MSRHRKLRIRWFRLTLLALVVYFIFLCVGQQSRLSAINSETRATRQQLEQLQQINDSLAEEREQLNNPAYIEKLAREELGLVKPGETPYIPAKRN
ncbi:MAG: septum formation initiator family protein [Veillonellales bacterium]